MPLHGTLQEQFIGFHWMVNTLKNSFNSIYDQTRKILHFLLIQKNSKSCNDNVTGNFICVLMILDIDKKGKLLSWEKTNQVYNFSLTLLFNMFITRTHFCWHFSPLNKKTSLFMTMFLRPTYLLVFKKNYGITFLEHHEWRIGP